MAPNPIVPTDYVSYSVLKGLFDSFQKSVNMISIPAITRDGKLKMCNRIDGNNATSLARVPNRTLQPDVKSRLNMFSELFKACMSKRIFPAAWLPNLQASHRPTDPSVFETL